MADNDFNYIVNVRPGSAAGQPYRFQMPATMLDQSVEEVVKFGLQNGNATRKNADLAATIQREMNGRGEYGFTANEEAVKPDTKVRGLFQHREVKDETTGVVKAAFQNLDLIVASKQKGGLY